MPLLEPTAPVTLSVRALPSADAAAAQVMEVLPRVMDAMRRAMRSQLDAPITVPQFRALAFVDREPGASVTALAAFLGIVPASASAMVDRLVRAGYLSVHGCAADRRRSELRLSETGRAVLRRMHLQTQQGLARALGHRDAAELSTLVAGLDVLDAAFADVDHP